MSTADLFREIMDFSDVIAAAVVKRQKPSSDQISKRQAYEEYGRPLIDGNTAPKGVLRPIRMGKAKNSPVYYSRMEIAALLAVKKKQRYEPEFRTRKSNKL